MAVDDTLEVVEPEVPSMLDLSDEDFNNLPVMDTAAHGNADSDLDNNDPDLGSDADSTVVANDSGSAADDSDGGTADASQDDAPPAAEVPEPKAQGDEVLADDKPASINYQEEYEKLTKPFKANGGEIQVKDTAEIMTLMQMGANYHKKMAALKPSIKLVKLLERHGLTDEAQLGYLIDLSKKDPAAIQKLVKESGIDPLDIDVAAESTYTPTVSQISDNELQIDAIIDDIKETPTYVRTLQVVAGDWDIPSRNAVAANPQIIKVINDQISTGIYDKVVREVERARQFGKLQGVSDFEAYKQVGDWMSNQGMLQAQPSAPVKTNVEADAQKKIADDKRNAQRKAAGAPPVKKSVAPVTPAKSGLLNMPDEEFLKLPASAYTKIT